MSTAPWECGLARRAQASGRTGRKYDVSCKGENEYNSSLLGNKRCLGIDIHVPQAKQNTGPTWDAVERFRPTADHLPVLIWTAGTDKLCTWFNKTWLAFVGRTMEQELGNGWVDNVHRDDFARCLDTYVTSFDQRVPFRMEYRLRRYDGEYHWILDEGLPLFTEGGEFAGYIGSCLIVTDQKEAENKLQVLNEALVRANEDLAGALERERRITQTLQSAFLPPYLPNVDGIEFQAVYRPAERQAQVGGDWYDAFVLRDGRIAVSIGDVFGHGLEAAGAMIRVRETLRALTGVVYDDPGAILQAADRVLQARHVGSIASGVFSIYDPTSGRMLTANAGHPYPVLVRGGKATLIRSDGVPLGVLPNSAFEVHECQLQPGDAFVLYTDGLVESKRDFVSGEQLLLQHLEAGPIDAEALVSHLTANSQQDDVAVLVLSVSTTIRSVWQFNADDAKDAHQARRTFVAHLRELDLEPASINDAALVFGELVANVVRHAPGPIDVQFTLEEDGLVLKVRDRGPSFSPGDFSLPTDVMSEGGRGLFLVGKRASFQSVKKRSDGGNEVCVRIPRTTSHAGD